MPEPGGGEFFTLESVDWFNHRRLLEPIGDLPPAEFEARTISRPRWPDSTNPPFEIPGTLHPAIRPMTQYNLEDFLR